VAIQKLFHNIISDLVESPLLPSPFFPNIHCHPERIHREYIKSLGYEMDE
jgi:hypothetical protein